MNAIKDSARSLQLQPSGLWVSFATSWLAECLAQYKCGAIVSKFSLWEHGSVMTHGVILPRNKHRNMQRYERREIWELYEEGRRWRVEITGHRWDPGGNHKGRKCREDAESTTRHKEEQRLQKETGNLTWNSKGNTGDNRQHGSEY